MNTRLLSLLLVVAILNTGLGLFVYLRNPKHLMNKLFAFFVGCFSIWTVCTYMIYTARDISSVQFWGRIIFIPASLIALSFFYFSSVFPDLKSLQTNIRFWLFTICGLTMVLIAPSDLLVKTHQVVGASDSTRTLLAYEPVFGPAHPIFGIYFLSCFGHGLLTLAMKWRRSHGIHRLQIQYLFLGVFLAAICSIITNLLIPLFFNTVRFGMYGPLFSIFMIAFTAHAIVRYRLMDIHLVLKKGLVYLISIVVIAEIWLALALGLKPIGQLPLSVIALILVVAISFEHIRKGVELLINRYFYRPTSSYQKTLRQASQALTTVLDFQQLLDYLADIILQTMMVDFMSILLYNESTGQYESRLRRTYLKDKETSEICFAQNSEVIKTLHRQNEPLVRDEIDRRFPSGIASRLLDEMTDINAEVVCGMSFKGQLIGLIGIGAKLSGDTYFAEDLEILRLIADQTAIAVRNAELYRQVTQLRQYNEDVLNHIESGVIVADHHKKITMINSAAGKIAQVNVSDLVGRCVTSLDMTLAEPILRALHTGESQIHHEGTLLLPQEQTIPVLLNTSLIRDASGEISDVILAFDDQSRIKSLELERNKAQQLALLGTLAASLAHEIKNPLVSIRVLAELLPEKFADPEFRDHFSKIALAEIDRMDALISQFRNLDDSKSPQLVPVDPIGELEGALSIVTSRLVKQGVNVVRNYAPSRTEVQADAAQLKQVFLNLLLNSLEAMKRPGEIRLKSFTALRPSSRQTAAEEMVGVSISDTGLGIADENLHKVFHPFFTTKAEGTGLGLTICERIIDGFNGSIEVQNKRNGEGVTVTVYLQKSSTSPT